MSVQAMTALAKANVVRLEQAAWKRHIASLTVQEAVQEFKDLLASDEALDSAVGRLRVHSALCSIHMVGKHVASGLLRDIGVTTHERRLMDLTRRQREELSYSLGLRLNYWSPRKAA